MLVTLHRIGLSLAIALTLSTALIAAKTVHLLGFVDELCPDEPHCFDSSPKSAHISRFVSLPPLVFMIRRTMN
jgi:hypothetical protein